MQIKKLTHFNDLKLKLQQEDRCSDLPTHPLNHEQYCRMHTVRNTIYNNMHSLKHDISRYAQSNLSTAAAHSLNEF